MSAFVGYWGNGNKTELAEQFAKILADNSPAPQFIEYAGANTAQARLAFWGKHAHAQVRDEKLTATFAASGLRNEADVKIEINRSGLKIHRNDFGRANLFWMQLPGGVWFSTQFQLLLRLLDDYSISLPALYGYTCFSYVPAPLTPVKTILAIPAGATVQFQSSESVSVGAPARIEMSWSRAYDTWQEATLKETKEIKTVIRLQSLLTDAMQRQLADRPSEPVGVFLSGGLDSSIVAALLVRAGVKVKAFTLDFGAHGTSEVPHAERVAQYLKIPLVKVAATPESIKDILPETVSALDLPYGDGVTAPLYLLGRVAANECDVVFNGEGGDQLFAGWTNKPLIAADVYKEVTPAAQPTAHNFYQEYLRTFHRLHGYEEQLYEAAALAEIQKIDPLNWLNDALDTMYTPSFIHRLRRANLMLKGAQNIQPRATNLAIARGLSLRTPFCDPELAQFTFTLGSDMFLQGAQEKYILKKAVEPWLPDQIVWREKRGMGVPLSQWCLGPLWNEVGNWLQPAVLRDEGIWQEDLALRISTGQFSGQIQGRRVGEALWLLMMWQNWRASVLHKDVKREKYTPFMLPAKFWQVAYSRLQHWMKPKEKAAGQ